MAALRAPRAHDELGRRARTPRRSRGTTGAPATTSSRSPITGTAATHRRRPSLVVLPSVELNCLLPERPRRPRARDRDRATTRPSSRASAATSRRPATGSSARAESPISRIPTGPASRPGGFELPASVTGIEVFNAGCELEVGRGLSSVHWDELLEAGRLCPALVDRRQPPSRLRLRPRVDVGARGADAAERARRAAHRPVLRQHRPGDPRRRRRRRRGRGALHACALGDAADREDERARRSTPAGSGTATARTMLETTTGRADRRGAARPARDGAVRARRGRRRVRAGRRGRTRSDPSRARPREALARTSFDLLVIGGGMIGAGDRRARGARRARRRARRRAATSAPGRRARRRSSIHGGLRYLRLGDVRLVREAHHERRTLTRTVAPHLVHRLPFLLPLYRGGPFRPAFVQSGILLYSTLARLAAQLARPAGARRRARARAPPRRPSLVRALRRRVDERRAALPRERRAAAASTARRCSTARRSCRSALDGGAVAGRRGRRSTARSFAVARARRRQRGGAVGRRTCAGSRIRGAGTSVRLSKGVHVLVPVDDDWTAALTMPQDDVRVTFAVPVVRAAAARHDRLGLRGRSGGRRGRRGRRRAGPRRGGDRPAVVAARPRRACARRSQVFACSRSATARPRTRAARRSSRSAPGGMLSVAGGKLTTYRKIALDALERVREPARAPPRRPASVPASRGARRRAARSRSRSILRSRRTCAISTALARPASSRRRRDEPSLLERIHPDGPDIAAQARFAVDRRVGDDGDDVLRRRTTVALRGLADADVVDRGADRRRPGEVV